MPTISQVRPRRPKPREKARLSLDKWVMRVNREIQKRKRWRDEIKWRSEGYVPGEKFKQLRLDEKTGELQWIWVIVTYKPASEIFGAKLGPGGRAENVRVVEERALKARDKIDLRAINRKYRCIYRDEILDKKLLGGWNRKPRRRAPWTS